MTTPARPWVQPVKSSFKNINNVGQIIINASSSPFVGRLDNIFISNQSNGEVIVTLSVVSNDVSYDRLRVTLAPNEMRSIWTGEVEYIVFYDIYSIGTDAPTNLITCSVSYIIYNELLP